MEFLLKHFHHDLNQFAAMVWGNSQTILRQHQPGGFEYIDLGASFKAFQCFFLGALKHDKLLVRNEYRTALQALQEPRYSSGAVVLGQPGIGKSLFLIYALVHLLGQKQPVALQTAQDSYVFFTDTVSVHSHTDPGLLLEHSTVWALCDSNHLVQYPFAVFSCQPARIRVILSALPKRSRWQEWSKLAGAKRYIMDIWTDEEIANLAVLLQLNIRRITTLAKKWGNVPRTLLDFVDEKDSSIEDQYYTNAGKAVSMCQAVMSEGLRHILPDEAPFSFYFLVPQRTENGVIDHQLSSIHIPTPTLRRFLAEALQLRNNATKLEFYNALGQHPDTRQAAGFIFESWFNSYFVARNSIQCHWLPSNTDSNTPRLPGALSGASVLAPATLNAPGSQTPPYFWIPPHTRFPGIDSALVLDTGIFAFQITLNSNHRQPTDGLRALQKKLPESLKYHVPWSVIFVGLDGSSVTWIAEKWNGQVSIPGPPTNTRSEIRVQVGWSVVVPEQEGVTYKEYREFDVVSEALDEIEVDRPGE